MILSMTWTLTNDRLLEMGLAIVNLLDPAYPAPIGDRRTTEEREIALLSVSLLRRQGIQDTMSKDN
jgi:hypothetical protein